jgi:hypothetical protein
VSDQAESYNSLAGDDQRVGRSLAASMAGLAVVLGTIASIDVSPAEQAFQDLVFGAVLGATYGVTTLSARMFDIGAVRPSLCLLLAVTTVLWFAGLKHQFAFASATVFVVGQLVGVGLAIALRGAMLAAAAGIVAGWLLFGYLDPRIVLLTRLEGSGSDRLLGSAIVVQAALPAAAITIWWLTRRTRRPAES